MVSRLIWVIILFGVTIVLYAIGTAIYFGNARGQEPVRYLLVKIYAKGYADEIACNLDLAQAAMMSPAGTRFKCERARP